MSAPEAIVTWRGPVAEGAKLSFKDRLSQNEKSRVQRPAATRLLRSGSWRAGPRLSLFTRCGIVKRVIRYCRWRPNTLMLGMERRDRNPLDKLSGLSCFENPALQAPVGAGLSVWFRGHFAVAL